MFEELLKRGWILTFKTKTKLKFVKNGTKLKKIVFFDIERDYFTCYNVEDTPYNIFNQIADINLDDLLLMVEIAKDMKENENTEN